jgi:hypothetical protein
LDLLTDNLIKNNVIEERDNKKFVNEYINKKNKNNGIFKSSISKVRQLAEEDSIKWNETKYLRTKYEVKGEYDVAIGNFTVKFEYLDKEYSFTINDCIYFNNQWYLGYISKFNYSLIEYRKCKKCNNYKFKIDKACSKCGEEREELIKCKYCGYNNAKSNKNCSGCGSGLEKK